MIRGLLDEIVRLPIVDSTNDAAKRTLDIALPEKGLLFITDEQVKGRGRLGREWKATPGKNVMMSLLRGTNLPSEKISAVTLLAGVAVADSVIELLSADTDGSDLAHEVSIKWPNDIVINKKKLCGILTELCVHDGKNYVIAGIGINVNEASYPADLEDKATSLRIETGKEWDREKIIESVISKLMSFINKYEETGSLEFIRLHYNDLLISKDSEVFIVGHSSDGNESGDAEKVISRGIDETGALLVEDICGNMKSIISGEVSIRGLYGYV